MIQLQGLCLCTLNKTVLSAVGPLAGYTKLLGLELLAGTHEPANRPGRRFAIRSTGPAHPATCREYDVSKLMLRVSTLGFIALKYIIALSVRLRIALMLKFQVFYSKKIGQKQKFLTKKQKTCVGPNGVRDDIW
jgi:hypothetical protein